jgi:hypothetical protein
MLHINRPALTMKMLCLLRFILLESMKIWGSVGLLRL